MKKFLLVLFGLAVILLLVIYFSNKPKTQANKQPIETPPVNISQTVNRPILGIHYRIVDNQTALANKLAEGAYVTQVIEGSPAEKAKLQEEDIITEIDSRSISGLDEQSIYNLISTLKPGSKINLKIWRNNNIFNVFITLDSNQ
ncbi:MAG: PDZ domain-containing protein [Patescibacteria group bacterium]|jgi:S1-C subfamily serine protease